jgi:hypothetical protein
VSTIVWPLLFSHRMSGDTLAARVIVTSARNEKLTRAHPIGADNVINDH